MQPTETLVTRKNAKIGHTFRFEQYFRALHTNSEYCRSKPMKKKYGKTKIITIINSLDFGYFIAFNQRLWIFENCNYETKFFLVLTIARQLIVFPGLSFLG